MKQGNWSGSQVERRRHGLPVNGHFTESFAKLAVYCATHNSVFATQNKVSGNSGHSQNDNKP
jgi:hypothetical protein